MNKQPCFGCTERAQGCHASCERYIEWNKEHIAENKARRAQRLNYDTFSGYQVASINRNKKRMRK